MRTAEDWEGVVSAAAHLGVAGELVRIIERIQADALQHAANLTVQPPKYWHETARCPVCLRVGELRIQFGTMTCPRCDIAFAYDRVQHFNAAFEKGREFERNLPLSYEPPLEPSRPTEAELKTLYTALKPGAPYPVTCDFCGAKTDSEHAVPEESDMWACDACWERFEKEDANNPLHEGAD